ncbi:hypothetical protein GM661_00455 [Iocasia frigidifontis]|uniref:Uncharacterized protein n=1 Tax=Iocasia fonsfrigidae TaxID=2682810 RepID=A0A8A7KED7_9FIRM|nr:hypothetical protein [Iocasia fonsfrigidae]QTL96544.1 hypothetical protein GM661_00455 [Iocasia fonsfrigidae]
MKCPKTKKWLPSDNEECPICEYYQCNYDGFVLCSYYIENPKHYDNRKMGKLAIDFTKGRGG